MSDSFLDLDFCAFDLFRIYFILKKKSFLMGKYILKHETSTRHY